VKRGRHRRHVGARVNKVRRDLHVQAACPPCFEPRAKRGRGLWGARPTVGRQLLCSTRRRFPSQMNLLPLQGNQARPHGTEAKPKVLQRRHRRCRRTVPRTVPTGRCAATWAAPAFSARSRSHVQLARRKVRPKTIIRQRRPSLLSRPPETGRSRHRSTRDELLR
jgi:hypothetical protein